MNPRPFPALTGDAAQADEAAVLRANLVRIFNEPDPAARQAALEALWTDDGELVEPDRIVLGRQAISDAVGALQAMLPPGTRFVPEADAVGHHGLARLRWRAVAPGGAAVIVSGEDIALLRDGRIARLYVLLAPEG